MPKEMRGRAVEKPKERTEFGDGQKWDVIYPFCSHEADKIFGSKPRTIHDWRIGQVWIR